MYHAWILWGVTEVSIRELRNQGGDVVDRAARGEQITITRAGRAVARAAGGVACRALGRDAAAPLASAAPGGPVALRRDVDRLLDARL